MNSFLNLTIKELHKVEDKFISYLLYALSALFGTWFMFDRKRQLDDHNDIEMRLRVVEQSSVGEQRVRRMIEDVVSPIKESQTEIKTDLKELLRLMIASKGGR